MYKIDKDIPVPEGGNRKHSKYPLSSLEEGDSFFVPLTDLPPWAKKCISQAVSARAKRLGIKLLNRKVTEGGVDGWRVWRCE